MSTGDGITDKDEREYRNEMRDRGYKFPNNPVAKSSTSVLQASVCQRCGCKLDGKVGGGKIGCKCQCHEGAPK